MYMLNKYLSEGIQGHLFLKTKRHHRDQSNVHFGLYFWENHNAWHKIDKMSLINMLGEETYLIYGILQ